MTKITSRGYEIRTPVTEKLMRVVRYDQGGITKKQRAVEIVVNAAIFATSAFVASWLNTGFAVLWVLLVCFALPFLGDRMMFEFYQRVPPSQTIIYEGANIPPELLARYEQAEAEFQAVMDEIQQLR